jgi:hypothetical protein
MWIRTELTCSTRRAVTRILEVADEVVMLERSGDEEDRIERNPRGKKPPASSPGTNCHTLRCYASRRAGTTSRRIDPTVRPRRQTVHFSSYRSRPQAFVVLFNDPSAAGRSAPTIRDRRRRGRAGRPRLAPVVGSGALSRPDTGLPGLFARDRTPPPARREECD